MSMVSDVHATVEHAGVCRGVKALSCVRDCTSCDSEVLCSDPVVLLFRGFLSPQECEEMVTHCRPQIKKCEVIGATNRNCDEEVVKLVKNNSWITWMKQGEETEDCIVAGILNKAKERLGINFPPNNEVMQVHLYEPGQVCEPHHDFYEKTNYSLRRFGQRVATLIFYLNDVDSGGSTAFPRLGIKVAPKMGDLLFFHNVLANGEVDHRTLHAGEQLIDGEKWIAIKVINEDTINCRM